MSQDAIIDALKSVKYPGYSRDVVSFGLVKNVAVNNGAASVVIELSSANTDVAKQLKADAEAAVKSVAGIKFAHVEIKMPPGATTSGRASSAATTTPAGPNPWAQQNKVPGIARIIA